MVKCQATGLCILVMSLFFMSLSHCNVNGPNHFPQCSGVSLTPIHLISALHATDWVLFLKGSSNLLYSWIKKSLRATPSYQIHAFLPFQSWWSHLLPYWSPVKQVYYLWQNKLYAFPYLCVHMNATSTAPSPTPSLKDYIMYHLLCESLSDHLT